MGNSKQSPSAKRFRIIRRAPVSPGVSSLYNPVRVWSLQDSIVSVWLQVLSCMHT